jgi:hypothetical protein
MSGARVVRVLPWATPDGKTCLLVGDGTGLLSRIADDVESVQLDMAEKLLGHASEMLDDRKATAEELRYLGRRLAEALRDVCRMAGGGLPGEVAAMQGLDTGGPRPQ